MAGRRPRGHRRRLADHMDELAPFEAPWWLGNRHAQTLYTSSPFCRPPSIPWRTEVVDLPDGDFLEADWLDRAGETVLPHDSPIVLILHGLEGSSEASYARMLAREAAQRGWRTVVLHFRDCGRRQNRLPRRYHAGDTADPRFFISGLHARFPGAPLVAAGFSLGGNVLLKLLGEDAAGAGIRAAVAVSVPFDLQNSADALELGPSRFYRWYLLRKMKAAMRRKFRPEDAPFDWEAALRARDFPRFDDLVTAPLHGFQGKDHYYAESSCGRYLRLIGVPTLIVNAMDDPFMTTAAFPASDELPDNVQLLVTRRGGHIGFVAGRWPWRPRYWLPGQIARFLEQKLSA